MADKQHDPINEHEEPYIPALIDLDTFQQELRIRFNKPEILLTALTHRSYVNELSTEIENNERLEFLGDAVLDLIVADLLYKRFPNMPEGEMTRLRAALVRTEALAKLGADCRVGEALLMGKGEANSGGRERETNLCRGFEAVIGAIYLDQGLDKVRKFVTPRFAINDDGTDKDPRSQFQEWAQEVHAITPEFHVIDTTGPEHEKIFIVGAYLEGKKVAEGTGKSKRAAAQSAASNALSLNEKGELPFKSATKKSSPKPNNNHR
jgi:ribonuclease-3